MNAHVWTQTLKADGEVVLTLSLRRPDFSSGSRACRRIERYYQRLNDTWKRRWETELFARASEALKTARAQSRPFNPWSAALDFVVTREDADTLSLYLNAVVQGPARHPLIVRSADTWNRKTGAPMSLALLLPPALRRRRSLLPCIKRQAAAQLSGGESLYFQDVEARVARFFSPRRFYLTEQGPVVFYPMLSLGSPAERIPTFLIS